MLRKIDEMLGKSSILLLFLNEFNKFKNKNKNMSTPVTSSIAYLKKKVSLTR